MQTWRRELKELLEEGRPSGWRRKAVQIMKSIPEGHLASYSAISEKLRQESGFNIPALTIGWLRGKLYGILRDPNLDLEDRPVSLHRITTKGDVNSKNDSDETKAENDKLRRAEGSIQNPVWMDPAKW